MSNEQDNNPERTAMMISIQRKKDRIKKYQCEKLEFSEIYVASIDAKISELVDQIAEDEKLLVVDRQNHIDAHIAGMDSRSTGRPELYSEIWFNDKYGTDGK